MPEPANLFDGLLPPGWTATPDRWVADIFTVRNESGKYVSQHKVDSTFPLETHVRNLWWKHTFPDAPPKLFLKYVNDPVWMPEHLRPPGLLSLDQMGSLGG